MVLYDMDNNTTIIPSIYIRFCDSVDWSIQWCHVGTDDFAHGRPFVMMLLSLLYCMSGMIITATTVDVAVALPWVRHTVPNRTELKFDLDHSSG